MTRKPVFALLVVVLSLAGLSLGGTPAFQPLTTYADGSNDYAVTVADFNGDGHPDLAVLNFADKTVSILLGNGDGTFQPATMFAGDTNSFSIATADFNGDHRADLVITGDSGVTVFLGNGDGTFQEPHSHNAGPSPYDVHVADFNKDGKIDLTVANANGVGVLLGNGDGSFQADVDYPVDGGVTTLVVADFNGDGKTDVVTSGATILLGNGDGTFRTGVAQGGPRFVRDATDFNHDGKLDLLVDGGTGGLCGTFPNFHFCGAPVGVMLGNGDGTFQAPVVLDPQAVTMSGFTADLDGDGNPDVAMIDGSHVRIFPGDGKGGFASAQQFSLISPNGLVGSAAVADLSGDDAPDIVAPNRQGYVGILLNSTGSDFSMAVSPFTPGTISTGQTALSTVNLSLLNSFHFPVSLSCSVTPATTGGPTCSFSSNSVTFDTNGKASATLTFNAESAAASVAGPEFNYFPWRLALYVPLLGFAFVGARIGARFGKKRPFFMVSAVLFLGILLQTACGGGGGSTGGPKSTAYTVTITGASGAIHHSTTVTVTAP